MAYEVKDRALERLQQAARFLRQEIASPDEPNSQGAARDIATAAAELNSVLEAYNRLSGGNQPEL